MNDMVEIGEPECEHEQTELRQRVYANDTRHFAVQCMTCGKQLRAVPKNEAARLARGAALPFFDSELSQRYWQRRTERMREAYAERDQRRRAAQDAAWWDAYTEHLASPEWQRKRTERLAMDAGRCQARLVGCLTFANQVHHLRYDRVPNEPLFDLVSICEVCHEQITAMDRARRNGVKEDAA